MATTAKDPRRQELEDEYVVWARLCEDKHGNPWPISYDAVQDCSNQELTMEIKKLKVLGRTPHEG